MVCPPMNCRYTHGMCINLMCGQRKELGAFNASQFSPSTLSYSHVCKLHFQLYHCVLLFISFCPDQGISTALLPADTAQVHVHVQLLQDQIMVYVGTCRRALWEVRHCIYNSVVLSTLVSCLLLVVAASRNHPLINAHYGVAILYSGKLSREKTFAKW